MNIQYFLLHILIKQIYIIYTLYNFIFYNRISLQLSILSEGVPLRPVPLGVLLSSSFSIFLHRIPYLSRSRLLQDNS